MSSKYSFKVIEILLGLMYDLLYTKAPLIYTRGGVILRLITFFLTYSVMVLFPVLIDKHKYSRQLSTSRWSNDMSNDGPWMSFKLVNRRIEMGKYWHCEVSEDLRDLIFMYVKQKAEDAETSRGTSQWRPFFAELPSQRSTVQ
ncbi:hypothetical protein Dsin_014370 [Dipteronia sinensis]|uniref:DUF4220 domain-containing protein n=1 Tax=Dipteronia sinensis TaxID=43782 RepID=A0AAE0AMD8_9ROSI|nr:hypothetical protein Dsin_014370 [Dipteronia sinensis]